MTVWIKTWWKSNRKFFHRTCLHTSHQYFSMFKQERVRGALPFQKSTPIIKLRSVQNSAITPTAPSEWCAVSNSNCWHDSFKTQWPKFVWMLRKSKQLLAFSVLDTSTDFSTLIQRKWIFKEKALRYSNMKPVICLKTFLPTTFRLKKKKVPNELEAKSWKMK